MFDNTPEEPAKDVAQPGMQQLPLNHFAVQMQNIFPVEIVAKRFPTDRIVDMNTLVTSNVETQLNLTELGIDTELLQAQIHLEVRVRFPHEPRLFEIFFKLAGVFSYAEEYQPENVQQFLQQGSLSIMLPSARELLLSLCNRLQVPVVVLPLIQLGVPSNISETEQENSSQE